MCLRYKTVCMRGSPHVVRAEGLEPSSSFEHGHLKPERLPVSPRPQANDPIAAIERPICRCRGRR